MFDSRDVIGNYNRNVNDEVRIGGKKAGLIRDLAFIPSDPSLDLLKGNVPLLINLQQSLRETLSLIPAARHRRKAARFHALLPERRLGRTP